MNRRRLSSCTLIVQAALIFYLVGCAKQAPEPVPPPSSPPPAYIDDIVGPEPFGNLRVVNDQPFPDMYFKHYGVNPTIDTAEEPASTFSVDVDTASYNLARAYLERRALPPEEAIRVEEFINSFDYHYPPPAEEDVFHLQAEAFPSPNRRGYHVLHLGLKGFEVAAEQRPPAHLVFVIDVSGSMDQENRLGLVKESLRLLVDQLGQGDDVSTPRSPKGDDTIGIVVYGSRGREVLEPTGLGERRRILEAIDSLRPEGSTNAQEGILLGYRMAARRFDPAHINRVVLCSDGVANNGFTTSADGIFDTVRDQAARGITISTVGFGMGNYNDILMERLAQIGDGNYHYVDHLRAARKIFALDLTATLQVIARDVKIQVVFDPAAVSRYRLLGYENRRLEREDFADDRKDAGEIGAGHAVSALYEIKLTTRPADLGTVRVRYKAPRRTSGDIDAQTEGGASTLIEKILPRSIVGRSLASASPPARLSLLAASFAEKLRGSYWVRNLSYGEILALHDGLDHQLAEQPEVRELRSLIVQAERLDGRGDKYAAAGAVSEMDFDHVPILR